LRSAEVFAWIRERHAVYGRKLAGEAKPWTQDPIIQSYRFCNVYRELDTVTIWIADNWRTPHTNDPDVWFAMAVARLVNWPDTLDVIGYPVPWDASGFVRTLEKLRGTKVFTGAYMIPAGPAKMSKPFYLATGVLGPLWEKRDYVRPRPEDTLASFHSRLMEFKGMGSFLAGQVVCDTKYSESLLSANDWWTWACSGPGSRRGLARVFNLPVNYNWKETEWKKHLDELRVEISLMAHEAEMPIIHAQDLQNCMCEFDKYERVRLGEGKPRNNYQGI
jgi:alpha-glutamyl/putrescinyl thymine pyrophosphorylase clade 1